MSIIAVRTSGIALRGCIHGRRMQPHPATAIGIIGDWIGWREVRRGGDDMAEPHGALPAWPPQQSGTRHPAAARSPSGLFPGQPPRPIYREPFPVTSGGVLAGIGSAAVWFGLFGGLARDLFSYAWWTVLAAVTAWAVATVLALLGDRGVAVGVAVTSGFGLSIAATFVGVRWVTTGDWPMW